MRCRLGRFLVIGVALLVAGAVVAQEAATSSAFKGGVSLRLREEAFDNFQGVPASQAVENNYFRIRPSFWGEYLPADNVTLRARAVNEFRHYLDPSFGNGEDFPGDSPYEFADELVFDHLYLDVRGLNGGTLSIRAGRQDLIYGTGKVILEGTPGDGSRTIYFNALKASCTAIPDTTVDVFGIYNPGEDPWAIESEDRSLTAYPGALDEVDEAGGGVYVVNKSVKAMPCEFYGIYKMEQDYQTSGTNASKAWQTVDLASKLIDNPQLDLGTAGFRLMPVFPGSMKGNLEMAYQFGDRGGQDVEGYMVDAGLTCAPANIELKPTADIGLYVLSGDDPSTDKDEGWNPLWARYPQYSELYVFWYPAGRWTDLVMPKLGVSCMPVSKMKVSAMVAYMMSEQENAAGEDERGLLGVIKSEFTLKEGLLANGVRKDKLTGHLWLEALEPGDYHAGDDTAYFARWQLMYEF